MSQMALELIAKAKAERATSLDLGRCGIVGELPEEIGELIWLEELVLSDLWWDWEEEDSLKVSANSGPKNAISGIKFLAALARLKTIVLQGTKVADIAPLANLRALETLDLTFAPVANIAPLANLRALKRLDLYETNVADISLLANLSALETLNLSGTKVIDIAPLANLAAMKKLFLHNTKIADIVPLANLRSLETLYLSGTQVADIAPLANLRALETLNLAGTPVADIAPLRRRIEAGVQAYLEHKQLAGILLQGCPLENPPKEVVAQGNQAILNYFMQKDKEAGLGDYINRDIKLIIIGNSDAGKTAMRIYLADGVVNASHASTHGMETVTWETNFSISEPEKTSDEAGQNLRVKIFDFGGQEYYHDTHHLFFTSNTAYIVVWDKLGNRYGEVEVDQKLANGKTEKVILQNAPLPYWLDAIDHFCNAGKGEAVAETHQAERDRPETVEAGESLLPTWNGAAPSRIETETAGKSMRQDSAAISKASPAHALVVQTKIDLDGRSFLPEQDLKQRFPFIYDFAAVGISRRSPMRLKQLLALLREMWSQMPIVGARFPRSTQYIIEALETYDESEWLMTKAGFLIWANAVVRKGTKGNINYLDEAWIDVLIPYLGSIGLLLHFPASDNGELRDKVFLRPDKVTDRIYKVLEDLPATEGRFERPHAWRKLGLGSKAILALEKTETSHPETEALLLLMRQFRIIFLEGGDPNRFVAPLYLPKRPIHGVQMFLNLFQRISFRVQYTGFIHKSVILHFFEAFGPIAYKDTSVSKGDLYYYWREGIVVKHADRDALVLLKFYFGEEKKNEPGTYEPAHVDVIPLATQQDLAFVQEIMETINKINEGWGATIMLTANGIDFVPYDVVQRNAFPPTKKGQTAEKPRYVFFHNDRPYQLRDFRDFIKLKIPMKKVFISYSKADIAHLHALENHLSVFKRTGLLDTWNCRKLLPGEKWDGKIKQELEEADIILFLVSSDFLATDYIWDVEIKRAIERDQEGSAKVVPIIVRSCVWQGSPLGQFNSPEKAAVITLAGDYDKAWTDAVLALEKIFV